MNLNQLHYFYIVAREGGFMKASRLLRIQQPAISRMVAQLEDQLGFELFEKIGRQVRLTAQGAEVFEHCVRIFGEVEDLKSALGTVAQAAKGPLRLGCTGPVAAYLVAPLLGKLLEDFPKIHPQVVNAPSDLIYQQILKGETELGLMFYTPPAPESIAIEVIKDYRFHLVVSAPRHKDEVTLQTFIGSREVDEHAPKSFPALTRLRRDHPQAKIRISTNDMSAHLRLVLAGTGVSILPSFMIEQELKTKRLVDLYPKEKFLFPLHLVKRQRGQLSKVAQHLVSRL